MECRQQLLSVAKNLVASQYLRECSTALKRVLIVPCYLISTRIASFQSQQWPRVMRHIRLRMRVFLASVEETNVLQLEMEVCVPASFNL